VARKQPDDTFSEQEAARRFEGALRGAFSTGPKPLKTAQPKGPKKET
jgi:hypothetical protein